MAGVPFIGMNEQFYQRRLCPLSSAAVSMETAFLRSVILRPGKRGIISTLLNQRRRRVRRLAHGNAVG